MKILLIIALLLPVYGHAGLELGTGYSSSHSGRKIPTLALALNSSSFVISGYATGVKNDYYYHSAYGLHAFSMSSSGTFSTGFGLGAMYSKRGFKDTGDSSEETANDYVLGPAFRVNWTFLKHGYINVDATYGLRDLFSHLTLNFQDVISTSIGVRLW
jgi:hypothetical protein